MATGIGITFLAGRYHATPWDRQVNEGEVEWPPSPWRLLRSFIAIWHRKVSPSGDGEAILESLIGRLASELPLYRLPAATHAHSRHYMPGRGGDADRSLVFDAWTSVDRDDELVVFWPNLDLPEAEGELLKQIVERLGYLGRSEAWVEGRVVSEEALVINCRPASVSTDAVAEGEPIRVPVPFSLESYNVWRAEQIRELRLDKRAKLKKNEQRLLATLPESLLDAMRLETAEYRGAGWSAPPGCRFETYYRPRNALEPHYGRRPRRSTTTREGAVRANRPTTLRFALGGRPAPRFEDSVRVGEVMRAALMATTDHRSGSRPSDSATEERSTETNQAMGMLSGHDLPRGETEHTFYLPEDANDDGRIDHVTVYLASGFPESIARAAGRINHVWRNSDELWPTILEASGHIEDFDGHPYLARSRVWRSVTPYLHPWYRKKKFDIEDQIRRECALRGWGSPEVERIESIRVNGKPLRPIHFHRFRDKHGLRQPDRRGSFWKLVFPEAVSGPVTLGFGRHFGLGAFRATDRQTFPKG